MAEVGSDAWIAALARRAATVSVDPSVSLVVQQQVDDGGTRRWHVVIGEGRVDVAAGEHPAPDVTFVQDVATAAAIEAGELSAQQAFVDGRLRVRGAVGRLADATAALSALGG
jgi:putative sterol carrier protein